MSSFSVVHSLYLSSKNILVHQFYFFPECGVPNRVTRIVGGHETQVNEYPWMVMLVTPSTDFNFCGGSLITSRHVLTAAHCTRCVRLE